MYKESFYWMNYSIEIANKANKDGLRVAALLVSKQNSLICYSYSREISGLTWSSILLTKLRDHHINEECDLYLTINTLKSETKFELEEFLNEIKVNNIFIGLPDPQLTTYFPNDPLLSYSNLYRFPDELQVKILKRNIEYFEKSKQSIKSNIHYYSHRISKIVLEKLNKKGIVIDERELEANKRLDKLSIFISQKNKIDIQQATEIVSWAIPESFDEKYGSYSYKDDVRSLDENWSENFKNICNSIPIGSIENMKIVNVGVGGGNEALSLFTNCKNITFVDIAPNGLKKIKKSLPHSKIIVARAENLSLLPCEHFDLYISLRTYNSSFFDIKKALAEAYKVLKDNSRLILSVANGFLFQNQNYIIPGLIIPGTEFVDIYRGLNLIKEIKVELSKIGFVDTKVYPTRMEIYILSTKKTMTNNFRKETIK